VVTVRVPLRERRDASYDIDIGHGLLVALPARLRAEVPADRYAIITDTHVGELYGARLATACRDAGLAVELLTFPAGEGNKTRETWAALADRLLAARFGRDGVVVALGGGVVGDVAGFVAATYLRGIPYVQVPTTLLAMIDSSIGGKTGVDTPAGKNLVGVFHQPRLVVADLDVLSTLPLPHMAAGMAEAIKHGVIADADYLRLAERERTAVLARDPGVLERVVTRSVEIKAGVVAGDERESGRRAVLNFGHTVGHALEATSRYAVLHGEAVGIGMAVEGRVAERLGIAKAGVASRIERVLASYGLPRERPAESAVDDLIAVMRRDKKTRAGEIRLALPQAIGRMAGSADQGWTIAVAENVLREILSAPREGAL
jgi:3-dehydroquinate synthase